MIYLDNSATTRPFDGVIDVMSRCMREGYFNASAAYKPAVDVDKAMRGVRRCIAAQLGAQESEVLFTGGGTEGDNLALLGVAAGLKKGKNLCVSAVEHPAVLETMERVRAMGHEIRVLPITPRGVVDLDACQSLIDEQTALVSCMQVSNETGAVQPIDRISAIARQKNPAVRMHVDGVQGFLRVPMHMARMGVDLYTVSGHKIHGPKGVGALVVRGGVRLLPLITGGGQERGLRSGTYNSPAILGMGQAVEQFAREADVVRRLAQLKARLWADLCGQEGISVNGPMPGDADSAPHILSIAFDGVRGEVMRNALEGEGILVSTGSACASHKQKVSKTLSAMELTPSKADGTIRVSLGLFNTIEEMDETAARMIALYDVLRRFKRR